jgi:hypothetical protein
MLCLAGLICSWLHAMVVVTAVNLLSYTVLPTSLRFSYQTLDGITVLLQSGNNDLMSIVFGYCCITANTFSLNAASHGGRHLKSVIQVSVWLVGATLMAFLV